MKKKTKMLALLGIVVVLYSMLLVALPITAIAAEEDDYVLGIYGNANEDDTIDMRDLTYVKLIFFGKKPETELADAKYDGKINPLDFIQIKLIIVGKEKELTVVDDIDRIVTVDRPVERIVVTYHGHGEIINAIGAEDKVVGVGDSITERKTFFPELSKLPSVGDDHEPDLEKIIELEPDIVIFMEFMGTFDLDKIELLESVGITVLAMTGHGDLFVYAEVTKKLGYALGVKDNAYEYIDWYQGYLDIIAERVEGLSEEDKPPVYYCWGRAPDDHLGTGGEDCPGTELSEFAGGIPIAGDLHGDYIFVDLEWVITQNPSIIVRDSWGEVAGYDVDDKPDATIESIMSQPGWETIDAVKDGEVYIIAVDLTCGHSFIGAAYLAKLFHPELFEDLDPQVIHQEFLTRFQHLDFDIYEQGVLFYPIPEEW